MNHTAENAYFGQAGFYIITDDNEPTQGLPMGKYDIGLALSSKQYKKDGSLLSPAGETWSLFGDVIHVYVRIPLRFTSQVVKASHTNLKFDEATVSPGPTSPSSPGNTVSAS
jgi:hypothetical protein